MQRIFALTLPCLVVVACAAPRMIEEEDAGVVDASRPDVAASCPTAQVKCGSVCTDTTKDPNNCGACGTKCAQGGFCAAGKCNEGCPAPRKICGQFCVDTSSDSANCGACGKACSVDQECVGGACLKKCAPGLTVCDMSCVDIARDPNHCGACDNTCGMNEICTGSTCCAPGQVSCNGVCSDLKFDVHNCSACGLACGGDTPYCANGKCVAGCVPTGQRQSFNALQSKTASGCWQGNPCGTNNYSFSSNNGINFQAQNQEIVCAGTTACVGHVGINTYNSAQLCQGSWDVYCDQIKVGTIDTVNKTCTGTAMTNQCQITFVPVLCSSIKLVAQKGSAQSNCCGGSAPDSMIVGVSAW